MALSFSDIEFSLNLTDVTQNELLFLKRVDDLQYLNDPNVIVEAVRRYETLWLPLISDYQGIIAAQMDIYWIWHTHMLSPLFYKKDMEKKFGKIINHTFLDDKTYESALNDIEALWISKYPHEPFELRITDLNVKTTFQSQFLYDVKSAAERQSSFYYQVSLPHFKSQLFLQQSLERYKMFLSLKRKYPNKFLVPCYDIDLLWHCHQVHPILYAQDCKQVLGRLLPHDDSVNDRSPDSELISFDNETRELWFQNYNVSFANSGCMFRGDSSRGQLTEPSKKYLKFALSIPEVFHVRITKIKVEQCNYKLKIYLTENSTWQKCVLSYDYSRNKIKGKMSFKCYKNQNLKFYFELVKKKGFFENKVIYSSLSGSLDKFSNESENEINITWPIEIDKAIFDTVEVRFLKTPLFLKKFNGKICRDSFYLISDQCINQNLLGPIPISILDKNNSDTLFGFHSVKNLEVKVLNVNVIHLRNLNQSIVQVFFDTKMFAISHLVANELLPDPIQIETDSPYPRMKSSKYDRAMIIKDNQGDWLIVVARWLRIKMRSSRMDTMNFQNQPGFFQVEIFHLRSEKQNKIFKMRRIRNDCFMIDNLELNFKTGYIYLRSIESVNLVPNYICLAFSISILFVLCKPRAKQLRYKISSVPETEILIKLPKWSTKAEFNEISRNIRKLKPKSKYVNPCKFDYLEICLVGGYLYGPFIAGNFSCEYCTKANMNFESLGGRDDLVDNAYVEYNDYVKFAGSKSGGCVLSYEGGYYNAGSGGGTACGGGGGTACGGGGGGGATCDCDGGGTACGGGGATCGCDGGGTACGGGGATCGGGTSSGGGGGCCS